MRQNTSKLAEIRITVAELAALSNLSRRRIYQLVQEKRLPPAEKGFFPLAAVRQLFEFYQRPAETLQREKMLKTTIERKLREHELGVMENKLCDVKVAQLAVTAVAMKYHAIVKARMDLDFARLVLERLEGLDETARQKVHDAVSEVARSVVAAIEGDCQKYDK